MTILKWFIYILLFSLCSIRSLGQVVAIQADRMNTLYICVPNPLTIAAENTPSNLLVVTTDNGEIRMDSFGRKGHYTIWPAHPGHAIITIKKKTRKGIKAIASMNFRVKYLPAPVPRLARQKGGQISKALLCVQVAPMALIEGSDLDMFPPILGFTVTVIRRNKEIFRRSMSDEKGARIDKVTNDFFFRLRNRDKVIFSEMFIKSFDCFSSNKLTDSLVFTITDAHKYHKPNRPKHGQQTVIDPITGEERIIKWYPPLTSYLYISLRFPTC